MNNQTQNRFVVNNNTLVTGVDMGKYNSVGRYILPDGRGSKPVNVTTDRSSFESFALRLEQERNRRGFDNIVVGMEPTGHYHEPLADFLTGRGITVVLVNPAHTHWAKELYDNSPGKTDGKDAFVIADLVRQGKFFPLRRPEGVYAELRQLVNAREGKVAEMTAKVNRLRRFMDVLFPEFFGIFKYPTGVSVLSMLACCPTPEAVLAMGESELAAFLRRHSRGRLGAAHAARLVDAAGKTVGRSVPQDNLVLQVGWLVDEIGVILRQVKELEDRQKAALGRVSYAEYLLSLKGVGVVTAAGILGETGDLNGYASAREILKLAGLNLYEISSGLHKGLVHVSKRGRPLLRKLLYLLALRLVKGGEALKEFYDRLVGRGVAAPKALVAVSRKAVQILFSLVRDGRRYVKDHVPAVRPVCLAA